MVAAMTTMRGTKRTGATAGGGCTPFFVALHHIVHVGKAHHTISQRRTALGEAASTATHRNRVHRRRGRRCTWG